jgi:hypothetical protein
MKKKIINKYYNILMSIEDFFGYLLEKVHKHRVAFDEKYWENYLN